MDANPVDHAACRCPMCGTHEPEHDAEFCQQRRCPYGRQYAIAPVAAIAKAEASK